MPKPVVLGGHIVTTPEEVFAHYSPQRAQISDKEWRLIRPLAVSATSRADYGSPWAALQALRYVARFLAWAHHEGIALEAEAAFLPHHVERFIATETVQMSEGSRGTVRGCLRKVGRAATRKAPWPPTNPVRDMTRTVRAPYSSEEVEGFWQAAHSQATERRSRVLATLLTLSLGAGLRPAELLAVSSEENVRHHPMDDRLWVILLEDRTVPVLRRYIPQLRQLCRDHPHGPLIGRHRTDVKDPLGILRKDTEVPAHLPPLHAARLRTTWMVEVLRNDIRIGEFMRIAGTISAKSLEAIAPYIPVRDREDEYLFKGAGLNASA